MDKSPCKVSVLPNTLTEKWKKLKGFGERDVRLKKEVGTNGEKKRKWNE